MLMGSSPKSGVQRGQERLGVEDRARLRGR